MSGVECVFCVNVIIMFRNILRFIASPKKYFLKLIREPRKYGLLIVRNSVLLIMQISCYLLRNTSFFIQQRMEIDPKSVFYSKEHNDLTGGFYPKNCQDHRHICHLDNLDNVRCDMLILLLRTIVEKDVSGEMAELGVYQGQTAKLMHYYIPEKTLHLFDTFEGFTERSAKREKRDTNTAISTEHFSDTSLRHVQKYIAQKNKNVIYHKGYFPDTIPTSLYSKTYSFVHLDADLYEPTLEGLKFFFPRLSKNGMIVIHDYNSWIGARKAVDDFFMKNSIMPIPMPDKNGSVLVVKP